MIDRLEAAARYLFHLQHDLPRFDGLPVDLQQDLAPHHALGQFDGRGDRRCRDPVDDLPPPEDDDIVGNRHDLLELVTDEDDGLALSDHQLHRCEQVVGLAGGQDGGRLVEDQHPAATVQQLENLDLLLLAHRQVGDPGRGIDLHAVERGQRPHLVVDFRPVQPHPAAVAELNIFGDGHRLHQFEVLVDHADTGSDGLVGRGQLDRGAVVENGPGIRLQLPGQNRHQRRLAGAVLAEQGQDPALLDIETDIVIGADRTEGFTDPLQADERRRSAHPAVRSLPARGVTNWDSESQGKRIQVSWLTSVI